MSNRIKKREENSFEETSSLIMGIFILAVLCALPVVFGDYYYNILEVKYQFYCGCVITAAVIMTVYGFMTNRLLEYFKKNNVKMIIKRLNITDWGIIAFWLCNVISWILCEDWHYEAFWGTSGRYNGVFLMTLYMLIYFLVTRFFCFRKWYLDAMLAVGIFVSAFGISDYFQMDVLGFKQKMVEDQKAIYTSTLGNINTYTVYVGVMSAVSMVLFSKEDNIKKSFWYLGNFILSIFALIMGTSDNAYLTLAVLFGLTPLHLLRTGKGTRRYLISVASFATVVQCLDWINIAYADYVVGIDSAFQLITNFSGLPFVVVGLWVIAGIASFATIKGKSYSRNEEKIGKWLCVLWMLLVLAVVGFATFVLYDANIAGNADRYGAIRSYVVFNDEWGTRRGYVWTRAMDIFNNKFTPVQKVFGYGPDLFIWVMTYYHSGNEVRDGMRVVYDSAHNEYIHYLITLGVAGLTSYMVFLVSGIARLMKRMKGRPEIAAIAFAVLAYAVQAVVNINIPIATPIVLTLLMMGLSEKKSGSGERMFGEDLIE